MCMCCVCIVLFSPAFVFLTAHLRLRFFISLKLDYSKSSSFQISVAAVAYALGAAEAGYKQKRASASYPSVMHQIRPIVMDTFEGFPSPRGLLGGAGEACPHRRHDGTRRGGRQALLSSSAGTPLAAGHYAGPGATCGR
jgi:hypothetical protein